jgi:hypothetical protein
MHICLFSIFAEEILKEVHRIQPVGVPDAAKLVATVARLEKLKDQQTRPLHTGMGVCGEWGVLLPSDGVGAFSSCPVHVTTCTFLTFTMLVLQTQSIISRARIVRFGETGSSRD